MVLTHPIVENIFMEVAPIVTESGKNHLYIVSNLPIRPWLTRLLSTKGEILLGLELIIT